MKPRLAWAHVWKHSGRMVNLYGGLGVYAIKREAELDLDHGMRLQRVEIRAVKPRRRKAR